LREIWKVRGGGGKANRITLSGDQVIPVGTRCVVLDKDGKVVCSGMAILQTIRLELQPPTVMTDGETFTVQALDEGEEYIEPEAPPA